MTAGPENNRYEQLYSDMHKFTSQLHERNKKRIKHGLIGMALLPVILGMVRWLTDSDKVLFLMIWILCLFALSAYLIGVEYLDHSIRKKLDEMTERESEFGGLLEPSRRAERISARAEGFGGPVETGKIEEPAGPDGFEEPAEPVGFEEPAESVGFEEPAEPVEIGESGEEGGR